jgi:WD40 repeat protein
VSNVRVTVSGKTWAAAAAWPIPVPGDRLLLAVAGFDRVCQFDVRAGTEVGDPVITGWDAARYGYAAAPLPDGRFIVAAAGDEGIVRYDVRTGTEYPPSGDEQVSTMWSVSAATLPDGRVLIGGAGHDGLVYRWDAATGQLTGSPLTGHSPSVKAITTAVRADGSPMFVTGDEDGTVLRWDASSGGRIGEPLPGDLDGVADLAVATGPGGGQVLLGLDDSSLYQWDPVSGEQLAAPHELSDWPHSVEATYLDSAGMLTAFVAVADPDTGQARIERWDVGTGDRIGTGLPLGLLAVVDDEGEPRMVYLQDRTLTVGPLPAAG